MRKKNRGNFIIVKKANGNKHQDHFDRDWKREYKVPKGNEENAEKKMYTKIEKVR